MGGVLRSILRGVSGLSALGLFTVCRYLFVLQAVSLYSHPDQGLAGFWVLFGSLALAGAWLLFFAGFGRARPAGARDWLRGAAVAGAVFTMVWILAPILHDLAY